MTILIDFRLTYSFFSLAIILGIQGNPALAEDNSIYTNSESTSGTEMNGLRRIEDGSVVSNIHTSKWRVFTDNARDYFLQVMSVLIVP